MIIAEICEITCLHQHCQPDTSRLRKVALEMHMLNVLATCQLLLWMPDSTDIERVQGKPCIQT